jgi:hypothetical protein
MIPWFLSVGMGIWLGVMAHRANRQWVLWAFGGALPALVVSTIVLGLSDAVFIPVSHRADVIFRMESIALAVAAVVLVGGVPAMIAHRVQRSKRGLEPQTRP